MEPTQKKPPTKRRRRWLVVAFVLLLVSLGTWWNWPRGDARFVGKWSDDPEFGVEVWDFRSNGLFSLTEARSIQRQGGVRVLWTHWHFDGSNLQLGSRDSWRSPRSWRLNLLRRTGLTFLEGQVDYRVDAIEPGKIQLTPIEGDFEGNPIALLRVVE